MTDTERPWVDDLAIVRWRHVDNNTFKGMRIPVECNCGHVYDLAAVHVTSRYADCSMWRCAKCDVLSDDRRFVHQPYRRLRD